MLSQNVIENRNRLMPSKNTPLIKTSSAFVVDCPESLYNAVMSFKCSSINKEHLKRLIGVLLYELRTGGHNINDFYKAMSKNYILKVFTDNFKKNIWSSICYNTKIHVKNKVTEEEAIIQTNGNWFRDKKKKKDEKPIHYRINPLLLNGSSVSLEYTLIKSSQEEDLNHLFPELINHFFYSFKELKINHNLLSKNIGEEIDVNIIRIGDDFGIIVRNTEEGIKYSDIENIHPFFIKEAKVLGQNTLFNVNSAFLLSTLAVVRKNITSEIRIIIDGPNVSIDNVEAYLETRNSRAFNSFKNKANSILFGIANPIISITNGRLSTPLTDFNRIGLKYLTLDDSNLTSLDLKSSQVVILANLMLRPKPLIKSMRESRYPLSQYLDCFLSVDNTNYQINDFLTFLIEEDIYIHIAKDLGIIRPMAKIEMLKLLFTEPNANLPPFKIRTDFPSFFEYLKEIKKAFKKAFGSSKTSLAYFLQMTEAHIFLECILLSIAKENIKAFSKHDSILSSSHASNISKILEIIESIKLSLKFTGNFVKEEYKVIDWTINPEAFNHPYYNLIVSHPYAYNNKESDLFDFEE